MKTLDLDRLEKLLRSGDADAVLQMLADAKPEHVNIAWPPCEGIWEMHIAGCDPPCVVQAETGHDGKMSVFGGGVMCSASPTRTFTGLLAVCTHKPQPPSPWDYDPKPGGWVYVRCPSGAVPLVARKVDRVDDDGFVVMQENYCYSKPDCQFAKCEPPPEV